jgi:hypothetical protein
MCRCARGTGLRYCDLRERLSRRPKSITRLRLKGRDGGDKPLTSGQRHLHLRLPFAQPDAEPQKRVSELESGCSLSGTTNMSKC